MMLKKQPLKKCRVFKELLSEWKTFKIAIEYIVYESLLGDSTKAKKILDVNKIHFILQKEKNISVDFQRT